MMNNARTCNRLAPAGQYADRLSAFLVVFTLLLALPSQADDRLVGRWTFDEGFQIVELMFRSDGRYQMDTRSTDSDFGLSFSDRGRYDTSGASLNLRPYEFFGEPVASVYGFTLASGVLTLARPEFLEERAFLYQPGSRENVLAQEQVPAVLVGQWKREEFLSGSNLSEEYLFRPDGHYTLKTGWDGSVDPTIERGNYQRTADQLAFKPYGGPEREVVLDFFGGELTLIRTEEGSGRSETCRAVPGSEALVRAKSAEANAFLSRSNWAVGIWEIRDEVHFVDLTLRPDGYYNATNATEIVRGVVRGRYALESGRIHLMPFGGQGIYSRDNGEFGKVEQTRLLDYYDGELQIINPEALTFPVALARKRSGSEAEVTTRSEQARTERLRPGWEVGTWTVNDPSGWMEFTFRPDHRYIAKSGQGGAVSAVERGRLILNGNKLTLAPYEGLGPARGFEVDLYDGNLFLSGDPTRFVVGRKNAGSESTVTDLTRNPSSLRGERGGVLGLWTARRPGENVELVFRPDGQFRLSRCANGVTTRDYGLYRADVPARTIVVDSRFSPAGNSGLDFYGNTLTIHDGGLGAPQTYTVNLGQVDAAIAASVAADDAKELIDAQWLARVPLAPRDPNAVSVPIGDLPADPNPGSVFPVPTVFPTYHLFRRLIPGFVYFNSGGTIRSLPVVNTREWHFFRNGRVLVRFKNVRAGAFYPTTIDEVTTFWGAYRVDPRPAQNDVLHLYADNTLVIQTDLGERVDLTLEDGRRYLFLTKESQALSEWAAEMQPETCGLSGEGDATLINTGLGLTSAIAPDDVAGPFSISVERPLAGARSVVIAGVATGSGTFVVERATQLGPVNPWQPVQTNSLPNGPFRMQVPTGNQPAAFFRLRRVE